MGSRRTERIARRYFVRGRVQGVGYRYFVEYTANALGVSGFVRNLDDGRVEVYAAGVPEQLTELEAQLWKGPRWAEVRGVDVNEDSLHAPDVDRRGFYTRH